MTSEASPKEREKLSQLMLLLTLYATFSNTQMQVSCNFLVDGTLLSGKASVEDQENIACLIPTTVVKEAVGSFYLESAVGFRSRSRQFSFYSQPQLSSGGSAIHPSSGSATGGTLIFISGQMFLQSTRLSCRFGSDTDATVYVSSPVVRATFLSSTLISCRTPERVGHVAGKVPVRVSVNGEHFSPLGQLSFTYTVPERVFHVVPPSGSHLGGTDGELSFKHIASFGSANFPSSNLTHTQSLSLE